MPKERGPLLLLYRQSFLTIESRDILTATFDESDASKINKVSLVDKNGRKEVVAVSRQIEARSSFPPDTHDRFNSTFFDVTGCPSQSTTCTGYLLHHQLSEEQRETLSDQLSGRKASCIRRELDYPLLLLPPALPSQGFEAEFSL